MLTSSLFSRPPFCYNFKIALQQRAFRREEARDTFVVLHQRCTRHGPRKTKTSQGFER